MSEARASGATVDRVYTPTVTRVKTVRVIPPTIQPLSDIPAFSVRPRRVAAYARVSTSSEEQLTSYEAQVKHYTEYIKSKEASDNWQFVDVYTDKGITGVSTKKREGFNRMIQDALAGKIDLIITKSVSRFARNTVDTLTAIRKLKEYGVEVYFEEQNIYTLDGKGEVLLTIMSSIAQEESRNISENVTWGMRKRFADGKVTMPYGQFMGYRRGKDGTPEVVEAEAEIVRTIFRRFLEGATPAMISRELNLAGIPCPSRKSLLSENEAEIAKARKKTSRWGTSTVENILANEKYKGDAILQKTYCTDYLLKTFVVNDGSVVPKYYAQNSHPAIVSPEVFDLAQQELAWRRSLNLFDSVTTIGERAFANCAQLEELTLPESVTSIGAGAFDGLTGLKKLTVLCDASLISEGSFADCASLNDVRLSAGATDAQIADWNQKLNRPWYDPILRVGEASALVRMPFAPTPAEYFEFNPATGLISAYTGTDVDVVVPREIGGVTVVGFEGYNVFASCQDFTNTETPTNQSEWVHLRTLVLPETIREIPDSLLMYCQQLESFICYAPVESTGKSTFVLCRSLKNAAFMNGVRVIDSYAFDSTDSLESLYFGAHVQRIAANAFNFLGLTFFVVDAEEIETGAFTGCKNLTSLHFTKNVNTIGARPDALALLPGLAADEAIETIPQTEPKTTAVPAEPTAAPAPQDAPVFAAQSAAVPEGYLGTWYGVSMDLEGTLYALSDLGLDAVLTINADSTVTLTMNGDVDSTQCTVQDGVLMLDGVALRIEDGSLIYAEEGMTMTLSREKPQAAEAAPVDESAVLDSYQGVWAVVRVTADGATIPARRYHRAGGRHADCAWQNLRYHLFRHAD